MIHAAFLRMMASRLAALVVTVAGFAVIGRLLTPEAFGAFALALAVFALVQTASEFGLRAFLIRDREPAPGDAGRAMGLVLTLSAGWGAAMAAAGWWGAALLPPGTGAALVVLGPALVFAAAGTVVEALLARALDFRLMSALAVLKAAIEAGVTIALALMGHGAVALAAGVLVARAVPTGLLVAFGGHARALRPRWGGWGRFRGFGLRVASADLVSDAGTLALNAVLTALQGAATLGLFNRAKAVHAMLDRTLLEGIKPVVLPVISRALAAGWSPAAVHARKLEHLCALCWPAFGLIALLAEPVVLLLLGPRWLEVVPAVRVLAVAGLMVPATRMSLKLFIAVGLEGAYLRITARQQLVRLGLGLVGAAISLEAFCAAVAAAITVKAAVILRVAHARMRPHEGERVPGLAAIAARGAAVAACTLAGPAAWLVWGPDGVWARPAAVMAVAAPMAAAGWLAGLALTRHPLLAEARLAWAARRGGAAEPAQPRSAQPRSAQSRPAQPRPTRSRPA